MIRAQRGDTVTIDYRIRMEDGTVFDSTELEEPLTFIQGEGKVLPAIEKAVLDMKLGQQKTVHVAEEEGFGPYNPELKVQIDGSKLAQRGIQPRVGLKLKAIMPDGKSLPLTVIEISDANVTLDGNHPLAGHALTLNLVLVAVN